MQFAVTYADAADSRPVRADIIEADDIDTAAQQAVNTCPGHWYVVKVEQYDADAGPAAEREQDAFVGLAFPVIRVRFAGPTDHRGSRYIATLRGVRHVEHYDHALDSSRNAYNAAAACWERYRFAHSEACQGDTTPRVLVPGDLDQEHYSFTVVPAAYLGTPAPASPAPAAPAPAPGVDLNAVARLEAFVAEHYGSEEQS